MASHRPHPVEGDDANTLLFDDCDGCERHTTNLGISLDPENWMTMWDKMITVEYRNKGDYASNNEMKLGRQMYHMSLALERYTTIDAATLFADWKLV